MDFFLRSELIKLALVWRKWVLRLPQLQCHKLFFHNFFSGKCRLCLDKSLFVGVICFSLTVVYYARHMTTVICLFLRNYTAVLLSTKLTPTHVLHLIFGTKLIFFNNFLT